jgi:anti-sigma B factor antagonist
MLNINKTIEGTKAVIALSGRLDTLTSSDLDAQLKELTNITELVFDFTGLEYVSSAGLRVLLSAQKSMKGKGTMKVTHVCDEIMQIFEVTGFDTFLTIE